MTNPTNPPCPKCGEVPNAVHGAGATYNLCNPKCGCLYQCGSIQKWDWKALADDALITALRTNGIHTIAELDTLVSAQRGEEQK